MNFSEYKKLAEKTLSTNFYGDNTQTQKLLHGAIGLSTEANELLDMLKKHIYYGKEIDTVNMKEELGDLMWYIAIFCREYDLDIEELMNMNIEKLKKRFGSGTFSQDEANNRDTDNELSHISK